MNKEKIIKILIVVVIIISVIGVYIFKNIGKAESNENNASNVQSEKNTQVNIYSNDENLPAIVEFGSTTCGPCNEMFPILDSIEEKYKDKIIVKFINVYEDSSNTKKYNIRVIPTQIFFDSEGKNIYRHEGVLSEDEIEKKLTEMGVK